MAAQIHQLILQHARSTLLRTLRHDRISMVGLVELCITSCPSFTLSFLLFVYAREISYEQISAIVTSTSKLVKRLS